MSFTNAWCCRESWHARAPIPRLSLATFQTPGLVSRQPPYFGHRLRMLVCIKPWNSKIDLAYDILACMGPRSAALFFFSIQGLFLCICVDTGRSLACTRPSLRVANRRLRMTFLLTAGGSIFILRSVLGPVLHRGSGRGSAAAF